MASTNVVYNGSGTASVDTEGRVSPPTKRSKLPDAMSEMEAFDHVYNMLVKDCLDNGKTSDEEVGVAMTHFLDVCNYNVPHGKKNRGLSVVMSYRLLVQQAGEFDLQQARILGWCIEWLQAYFLVADDIMDHSLTRRGQPCWYKRDGIGMMAINDSFYLEAAIYEILKKYFRSQSYYVDIVDLFHETTMQTVLGQGLDLLTADENIVDFSLFTTERYNAIVKWKTAYYSFYLPVALAMHLAGIKDKTLFATAKSILLEMGHFFQVQDDYLDCFGDPAVTGKVGTDIEDNKCSWLITMALTHCSAEQRSELEANYAKRDPACVARIKAVYSQLGIERMYTEYEEQSYARLLGLINSLGCCDDDERGKGDASFLPKQMFVAFADRIYKRVK